MENVTTRDMVLFKKLQQCILGELLEDDQRGCSRLASTTTKWDLFAERALKQYLYDDLGMHSPGLRTWYWILRFVPPGKIQGVGKKLGNQVLYRLVDTLSFQDENHLKMFAEIAQIMNARGYFQPSEEYPIFKLFERLVRAQEWRGLRRMPLLDPTNLSDYPQIERDHLLNAIRHFVKSNDFNNSRMREVSVYLYPFLQAADAELERINLFK